MPRWLPASLSDSGREASNTAMSVLPPLLLGRNLSTRLRRLGQIWLPVLGEKRGSEVFP